MVLVRAGLGNHVDDAAGDTTDVLRGTDRGDARREVEKLSKVSPIQRKASYLLRLDDAAQRRVSGLDVNGGRLDRYGLLVRSNAQYEILSDVLIDKQSQILLSRRSKTSFIHRQTVDARRHAGEHVNARVIG